MILPKPPPTDQFRDIKIQSKTIDLSTSLWGINPTNSVFIPQSLVLRSIVFRLNFNISKLVYSSNNGYFPQTSRDMSRDLQKYQLYFKMFRTLKLNCVLILVPPPSMLLEIYLINYFQVKAFDPGLKLLERSKRIREIRTYNMNLFFFY